MTSLVIVIQLDEDSIFRHKDERKVRTLEDDESSIAESEITAGDDVSVTSHDPSESSSHNQEVEISDSESDQENDMKTESNLDSEKSTKHSESGASAGKTDLETGQELVAKQNTENDLEGSGACKSEKSESIGSDNNTCDSSAVGQVQKKWPPGVTIKVKNNLFQTSFIFILSIADML